MKTLTISLPDTTVAQIDSAAKDLGISVEALIQASVTEKLERIAIDFDTAAEHILRKNQELYRRLA